MSPLLSFLLVLVIATLVGMLIHFVLSRLAPQKCTECANKATTANIWDRLNGLGASTNTNNDASKDSKDSNNKTTQHASASSFVIDSDDEDL